MPSTATRRTPARRRAISSSVTSSRGVPRSTGAVPTPCGPLGRVATGPPLRPDASYGFFGGRRLGGPGRLERGPGCLLGRALGRLLGRLLGGLLGCFDDRAGAGGRLLDRR